MNKNLRAFTFVHIGGKKRPFKWGTNSTSIFCEKRDITIKHMNNVLAKNMETGEITGSEIRDMMWAGLYAGARTEGKDIDFDEWDVGDWIDEDSVSKEGEQATMKAFKVIIEYVKDDAIAAKKKAAPKIKKGT